MGMALNLLYRGSFAAADKVFREVAVEAQPLGLIDQMSEALQGMSSVAFMRKDYRASIKVCTQSIIYQSRPLAKSRQLVNLGAALVGCGDHDAARKILIPLREETGEEISRQRILINLLEMAAKERDKRAFECYREELHGKLSLPELQVHYHLYLGKGYHGFWRPAAAMEERQIALAIATEHGLHQLRTFVLGEMGQPVCGERCHDN
jgi:hypothetical protein